MNECLLFIDAQPYLLSGEAPVPLSFLSPFLMMSALKGIRSRRNDVFLLSLDPIL